MEANVKKRKKKGFFSFIQELKEELKKVSWTTKKELISATKIVIAATFLFGIGTYLVDFVIKGGLDLIKKVALFIFG